MDDDDCFCGGCGASRQVNWSPAFEAWLCPTCRWNRCERLFMDETRVLPVRPVAIVSPERV